MLVGGESANENLKVRFAFDREIAVQFPLSVNTIQDQGEIERCRIRLSDGLGKSRFAVTREIKNGCLFKRNRVEY
jgi:hypothetical protein